MAPASITSVCNLLILEQPPFAVICQNATSKRLLVSGLASLHFTVSIFNISFGLLLRSLHCQLHHEIWTQAAHCFGLFLGKLSLQLPVYQWWLALPLHQLRVKLEGIRSMESGSRGCPAAGTSLL